MAANHEVPLLNFVQLDDPLPSHETFSHTQNAVIIELIDDGDDCVSSKDKRIINKKDKRISTPISSRGSNNKDAISVEDYAEQRDLNFAIFASLNPNSFIDLSFYDSVQCVDDYDDNDDVRVLPFTPSSLKAKPPFRGTSVTEVGESSTMRSLDFSEQESNPLARMFICEICADNKPQYESFKIKGCSHSYCSDCMKNYVASKLEDGASQINCPVPNCQGLLEPEYCREILPFEVFSRWGNLLCESVILASQKFYCPYKDCSALLIDDGGEDVAMAECPNCHRMFCAKCKVGGWHDGVACDEYQKLHKDEREKEDIMLRNLAKSKNWQRCPKCKFYVERSEGCLYMKCRCGTAFCYHCGAVHTDHVYHQCPKCMR